MVKLGRLNVQDISSVDNDNNNVIQCRYNSTSQQTAPYDNVYNNLIHERVIQNDTYENLEQTSNVYDIPNVNG